MRGQKANNESLAYFKDLLVSEWRDMLYDENVPCLVNGFEGPSACKSYHLSICLCESQCVGSTLRSN